MIQQQIDARQRAANRLTFIAIGLTLLFFLIALVGDWEGMIGLALGLLLYFIALLHIPLGIGALLAAFATRHHLRNLWIYGYFGAFALAAVIFLGRVNEWDDALAGLAEQVTDPSTVALREALGGRQTDPAAALAAIEAGADVDTLDRQGRTPLMQAAHAGNLEVVRTLLAAGASVQAAAVGGDTALHFAGAGGGHRYSSPQDTDVDPALVRALLDAGADPDARGYEDQTPLLSACLAGSVRGYELLREAGADPLARTRRGETCIDLAVEADRSELIGHLMETGLDPHVAGAALLVAVQRGKPALFRQLLEAGADPSGLIGNNESAVMRFVQVSRVQREPSYAGMYEALLASGRGARAFANGGYRELQGALRQEPGTLERLLALGLAADVRGPQGMTLLHQVAARSTEADVATQVQSLLAAGASIDAVDDRGYTALMVAASNGNLEVAEALLSAGADISVTDQYGNDALRVAARAGYGYIIDALAAAGMPPPPAARHGELLVAAREHGTSMAALLRLGLNPDAPDDRGVLPLFDSISYGDPEAVAALVAAGADLDLRQSGYSPLTAAVSRDRDAAITVLLAAGADPDQPDDRRRAPLDLAIKGRYVLSCMALIEGGATLTPELRQQILDRVINPSSRARGRDSQEALRALL